MSANAARQESDFPGQHEGEVVAMLFRQHPVVMRKFLIFGLLVILLAVLPLDFPIVYTSDALSGFFLKVAIGVPVVVLLVWAWRFIGWYYSVFLVTDQRILTITQKGLFDRKIEEWQLEAITNLNYHVGGFQAVLFGFGDITARTYIGDFEMKNIHHPAKIHEQLLRQVRKAGGGGANGSTQAANNARMGST